MGEIVECTRRMLRSLHDAVDRSPEKEVEIGGYMTEVTGDIIAHIGFGLNYNEAKKIFELLDELQNFTAKSTKNLWFPGSRFFRREDSRVKDKVDSSLSKMINARIISMREAGGRETSNDLLGSLLLSQSLTSPLYSIDTQLVMDECKTIYFAGHETTALILTWVIMLLATNPSWQSKARDQIFDIFGDFPTSMDSPLSSDEISKLSLVCYMHKKFNQI